MLAVADESFFSSSRMAVLTNGLLSFASAAVQIGNDGYSDDKTSPSIVFSFKLTATSPKLTAFTFLLSPYSSASSASQITFNSSANRLTLMHTHSQARDSQKNNNDDSDNNYTVSSRSNTGLSLTTISLPLSLSLSHHTLSSATNYGFFFGAV